MLDPFFNRPFPSLDIDERYSLREQSTADSKDFFSYYKNNEVTRYILATKPNNVTEAERELHYCRTLFYQKMGIYWSIINKASDKMIGSIGLYTTNPHARAEVCYDLSANYWNQGIMSRALRVVMGYAFQHIGLARIEAHLLKDNHASTALLNKLAFHHEATLKQYRYFQGRFYDIELYVKINPHYEQARQAQHRFQSILQQAISG